MVKTSLNILKHYHIANNEIRKYNESSKYGAEVDQSSYDWWLMVQREVTERCDKLPRVEGE